jgi:putative thioredoxin
LLELKLLFKKNPDLRHSNSKIFIKFLGTTGNLYKEIENNPKDLGWRYQLAVLHYDAGEIEEAINTLLEMIQIDRNWSNKSAQTLLLNIFNFLGPNHKLTVEGRKKLSKILY